MIYLSNNHFSHDDQVRDVIRWMMGNDEIKANELGLVFGEVRLFLKGDETLDDEYGCWLTDWIEQNTTIMWEDGEPVIYEHGDEMEDGTIYEVES